MTHPSDPPVAALRSLPRAILLGTALSAVVLPSLEWLTLMMYRELPQPPSLWVGYLAIKVVSGACLSAAFYAVWQPPRDPLRWYLLSFLLFLLIGGDMEDYATRSLGSYLTLWVGSSVFSGALLGTLFYVLERRSRARAARAGG
jgi:hypothetical protein